MSISEQTLHAEISVIPIGTSSGTSMSKEIAAALDAIRKIKDIKSMLTPMGTQIETNDFANILTATDVAHQAIRLTGAKRIIITVRINESLDRSTSFEKKVDSVLQSYNINGICSLAKPIIVKINHKMLNYSNKANS